MKYLLTYAKNNSDYKNGDYFEDKFRKLSRVPQAINKLTKKGFHFFDLTRLDCYGDYFGTLNYKTLKDTGY